MTQLIGSREIEQFRTIVARRFGLQYENNKLDILADVLSRRLDAHRSASAAAYLDRLAAARDDSADMRALASELTVGETYFFRNPDNFRALAERIVPDRARARNGDRRLRVLSAGCSTGEEAYTIAMVLRQTLPDYAARDIEIIGVDVNPVALRKAAAARYTNWSLRATAAEAQRQYFRADGREFVLDDTIRGMVKFEERNLIDASASLWSRPWFDVVFCRNVTMYFSPDIVRDIVRRIHHVLLPDGFLFLGHAETLRGVSHDFTLCHTHDTFYYQRRDETATRDDDAAYTLESDAGAFAGALPAVVESTDSWVDAIRLASERIERLASGAVRDHALAPAHAAAAPAAPAWSLSAALEAMRRERFDDALELLTTLPAESHGAPDTLLLRGALLTNSGRLDEAEAVCARLLVLDELNAGAHYLMALCREHAGDAAGSIDHDQTAIYLDAAFAMPHLHVGLAARRSGDNATARVELEQALTLLAREDSSRLLLFGGGFSRETLIQLCRTELRVAEAAP